MMAKAIAHGQLRILTSDGIHTFPVGSLKGAAAAEIRVVNDAFWLRLVTLGDLGFAEAYMVGDCEVSDLVEVFKVCSDCIDVCR
jgi:cyclopropane-fatty-acyl-phospholipid synthase